MEISFQNIREDMDAYYDYMLRETPEGKRIGKYGFDNRQAWPIMFIALLSALFWGATGNGRFSLFMGLGLFILVETLLLVVAGFRPRHFYGKEIYEAQEKLLTERDLRVFQLPKTVAADSEWLEIRSSESVHRWRWNRVDKIDLVRNFIFVQVSNHPVMYVPRRDFQSDQGFREFAEILRGFKDKSGDRTLDLPRPSPSY